MRFYLRVSVLFFCFVFLAFVVSPSFVNLAYAQVTAISTFTTGIQVAGDPPEPTGKEFEDWEGIPVALTDPEDNPSAFNIIDIKDVQIANDNNLLYIRVSYYNANSAGAFLAFDTDQDTATGFDIFGLGLVGSELGYVNDFVFDQRDPAVFNQNTNGGETCCTGKLRLKWTYRISNHNGQAITCCYGRHHPAM